MSNNIVKEDTECWICHRKAKEIEKIACDLGFEPVRCEGLEHTMLFVEAVDMKPIPVCCICLSLLQQISEDYIVSQVDGGNIPLIITKEDLKEFRFKVVEDE